MGLCFYVAGCFAWGFPELDPACCWGEQVLVPKCGPPGELTLINIPLGFCYLCPSPHSELLLTVPSPSDPLWQLGRCSPSCYEGTAMCWVSVHLRTCVHPPWVELLFTPALWISCTQFPLAFKAKCSGGSSSKCQTLRLTWRAIFMWELPCVAWVGLIFFGARAFFSIDICHLFLQCMLAVIPLIGGVTDVVVSRNCTGYWARPSLCSVVVTALSEMGSAL